MKSILIPRYGTIGKCILAFSGMATELVNNGMHSNALTFAFRWRYVAKLQGFEFQGFVLELKIEVF
jgi:hypothetical protein